MQIIHLSLFSTADQISDISNSFHLKSSLLNIKAIDVLAINASHLCFNTLYGQIQQGDKLMIFILFSPEVWI